MTFNKGKVKRRWSTLFTQNLPHDTVFDREPKEIRQVIARQV